jgi:hypothetical protein
MIALQSRGTTAWPAGRSDWISFIAKNYRQELPARTAAKSYSQELTAKNHRAHVHCLRGKLSSRPGIYTTVQPKSNDVATLN